MPARSRCAPGRSGVAAVEFAFALPLMLLLLVGVWEVGRMVEIQQIVSNAAREGARQAASGEKDYDEIEDIVLANLELAGIDNLDGVTVSIKKIDPNNDADDGTVGTFDPTTADQLDYLEIRVALPFNNVRWAFIDRWFFTDEDAPSPSAIVGRARWCSMKDLPITVDDDIPSKPL